MKFIFPQNYNFKNKLFGIIDYTNLFLNIIWNFLFILLLNFYLIILQLKYLFLLYFHYHFYYLVFLELNKKIF